VSFRRYDRTLHARVEQKNGTYSFDANDQATFSTRKLTDLVANYKDPKRCFFFEPQLLIPFNRKFAFSLQVSPPEIYLSLKRFIFSIYVVPKSLAFVHMNLLVTFMCQKN
jgi:hypothetical protein